MEEEQLKKRKEEYLDTIVNVDHEELGVGIHVQTNKVNDM